MKELIITIGLILLGLIIFTLIIGPDSSLLTASKSLMMNQAAALSD